MNYEPDNEHIEAGINEFSKFGDMLTIDIIAKEDALKYEEAFQTEWNYVFMRRSIALQHYVFNKKLNHIIRNKK